MEAVRRLGQRHQVVVFAAGAAVTTGPCAHAPDDDPWWRVPAQRGLMSAMWCPHAQAAVSGRGLVAVYSVVSRHGGARLATGLQHVNSTSLPFPASVTPASVGLTAFFWK